MKYNNFLIYTVIMACIVFFALSVGSDEFKATVIGHGLSANPGELKIISGEDAVINIEIKNNDDDKIFVKLGAGGVPDSWISYEKQLFNIEAGASENTKIKVHIPEGRIGDYRIDVTAKNPETNVEVTRTVNIEALPTKDKGMSGIPIFPPAEQPVLLAIDMLHLIVNGIVNLIF